MVKKGHIFQNQNFYDYSKHLTTLSISALVFLVTFADKFADKPTWPFLFIGSIISLLLAVVVSIVAIFFILSANRYDNSDDIPNWESTISIVAFLLQALFLITGLFQLAIFTTRNFG